VKVSAIIPAAGLGVRLGEEKQFKLLAGYPLFIHSIRTFINFPKIDEIVVVVPKNKKKIIYDWLTPISHKKNIVVTHGGSRRQDSVKNGVLSSNSDLICIHDAARPFITTKIIEECIISAKNSDGAVVAIPSTSTVKYSKNNIIEKTINRDNVWLAQTPQVFWRDKLLKAYDNLDKTDILTDESVLMEKMGYKISLVLGDKANFKITTLEDWKRAESYLQ
jgi:2-C-methyl-D-erythritol 4-phosphate cytidylyltransferase